MCDYEHYNSGIPSILRTRITDIEERQRGNKEVASGLEFELYHQDDLCPLHRPRNNDHTVAGSIPKTVT